VDSPLLKNMVHLFTENMIVTLPLRNGMKRLLFQAKTSQRMESRWSSTKKLSTMILKAMQRNKIKTSTRRFGKLTRLLLESGSLPLTHLNGDLASIFYTLLYLMDLEDKSSTKEHGLLCKSLLLEMLLLWNQIYSMILSVTTKLLWLILTKISDLIMLTTTSDGTHLLLDKTHYSYHYLFKKSKLDLALPKSKLMHSHRNGIYTSCLEKVV